MLDLLEIFFEPLLELVYEILVGLLGDAVPFGRGWVDKPISLGIGGLAERGHSNPTET